jgi:DNA-binding MarR family transcriptional regulator
MLQKEQYLHIPSFILFDKILDSTKKILFSEILNLSRGNKGCYASNDYFGKLLGINKDGASKQISKLKRIGYIETKRLFKNSKEYRIIKIISEFESKHNENVGFINIPYTILFDDHLSSTQKIILSEILALTKLTEGCFKSNSEFGKILGITSGASSKQIKELVKNDYITTKQVRNGNEIDYRLIELSSSYITRGVVPISLEGSSQTTTEVLPKSLGGTSCRNTINTINNSIEIVPELAQNTSTEKKIEINKIEIIEKRIIESCELGHLILEDAKRGIFANTWKYAQKKGDKEIIIQLLKEYKAANLELK